jgi:hypothetical protein
MPQKSCDSSQSCAPSDCQCRLPRIRQILVLQGYQYLPARHRLMPRHAKSSHEVSLIVSADVPLRDIKLTHSRKFWMSGLVPTSLEAPTPRSRKMVAAPKITLTRHECGKHK